MSYKYDISDISMNYDHNYIPCRAINCKGLHANHNHLMYLQVRRVNIQNLDRIHKQITRKQ